MEKQIFLILYHKTFRLHYKVSNKNSSLNLNFKIYDLKRLKSHRITVFLLWILYSSIRKENSHWNYVESNSEPIDTQFYKFSDTEWKLKFKGEEAINVSYFKRVNFLIFGLLLALARLTRCWVESKACFRRVRLWCVRPLREPPVCTIISSLLFMSWH